MTGRDLITHSELDDVDKDLTASILVLSGGVKALKKLDRNSFNGSKFFIRAETFI